MRRIICLFLFVFAIACEKPKVAPDPRGTGIFYTLTVENSTVSIRAVDDHGIPMEFAMIRIRQSGEQHYRSPGVETDVNGQGAITGLQPGRYDVIFLRDGYATVVADRLILIGEKVKRKQYSIIARPYDDVY